MPFLANCLRFANISSEVGMRKTVLVLFLLSLVGCIPKQGSPISSYDNDVNLIQTGDIIVTNSGNDTIIQLDSNGNYKGVLVDSQTDPNILFNALVYDSINKKLLYVYDHNTATFDAVMSISLFDGSVRTELMNSNASGTLPGVARLADGGLLILKSSTNTAEKFSAAGARIGAPFVSALVATQTDIAPLANGGFIVCSSSVTTPVRLYSSAGVGGASATSVTPGPSMGSAMGATGCMEDSSGNIIVAYGGANAGVRSYNAALSAVNWTYQDANNLTTPRKFAIRPNGNLLVLDSGFNHIVELNTGGGLVQVIGGAVLSQPLNIAVVK